LKTQNINSDCNGNTSSNYSSHRSSPNLLNNTENQQGNTFVNSEVEDGELSSLSDAVVPQKIEKKNKPKKQ